MPHETRRSGADIFQGVSSIDGTLGLMKEMAEEFELSEGLSGLYRQADHESVSSRHRQTIVMNIYTVKNIRKAVDDLIESNTRLSAASDRYAKALNWLTAVLVLVGVMQVILQIAG